MESSFSEQVPRANETIKFLPLFHTCSGFFARKHMKNNQIKTDDVCEVFEKKITYLFYGKPAFKYSVTEDATTQLSLYPVCFLFDLEVMDNLERIYPFDTGALHHGRLKQFMDENFVTADFELEPEPRRISDVVLHFFGSNERYLRSEESQKSIDTLDFESKALREMTHSYAKSAADERRVTIEVQAGETVPFSGGALIGMIVPYQYMQSALFQRFINKTGIKVGTYIIDVWSPKQSFSVLAGAAREFLRKWEYTVEGK